MRRSRWLVAGWLVAGALGAQAAPPVVQAAPPRDTGEANPRAAQPERPTVATHAGTVARGYVEFETGLEVDQGPDAASNHITTIVTKIGLAPRLQLSLFASGSNPDGGRTGFGDFAVGVKWRALEDHPLLGDFALLPVVKLPTGSVARGIGTGSTDASLWLISSRDVGPIHSDLNVAYTWRSDDLNAPRQQLLWTVSFGGSITSTLGWNAEWYGYPGLSGSDATSGLLVGPTWQATEAVVFDIGTIIPVTRAQPHALYLGVTANAGRIF